MNGVSSRLVSIIIPTYNRASLVGDAIESALAQTYPSTQIIVADDGSEDDTPDVVARFDHVEYVRQENRGQAAARNLGFARARGDYVATLDSDDVWNHDFLERSVACLETYDLDFVFSNHVRRIGDVRIPSDWERGGLWKNYTRKGTAEGWYLLGPAEARRMFVEACPAPSSSLVLRRSSIAEGWSEEMKIADDWCLLLGMVLTRRCRAAFTLEQNWIKRVDGSNIYDGRDSMYIAETLGVHDEGILAARLAPLLSASERRIFDRRIASHKFVCAYYAYKFGRESTRAALWRAALDWVVRDPVAAAKLAARVVGRRISRPAKSTRALDECHDVGRE